MAKFNSHCVIKISLRRVSSFDLSFLLTEIRTKNYRTHPTSISLVSTAERSTDTNAVSKAKGSNVPTFATVITPNTVLGPNNEALYFRDFEVNNEFSEDSLFMNF